MTNRNSTKCVGQLFRYMLLHQIDRFWLMGQTETSIKARVGWPNLDELPDYDEDEEVQDIDWTIQHFPNIENALQLAELIQAYGVIDIDKITVPPEELFELVKPEMNWTQQQFDDALDTLLEMKVDMVDEGEKSDYFFLHF